MNSIRTPYREITWYLTCPVNTFSLNFVLEILFKSEAYKGYNPITWWMMAATLHEGLSKLLYKSVSCPCVMLMYTFMHKALSLYGGEWLALCSNELHSWRKISHSPVDCSLDGPHSQFRCGGEEKKIPLLLPKIKIWPACFTEVKTKLFHFVHFYRQPFWEIWWNVSSAMKSIEES